MTTCHSEDHYKLADLLLRAATCCTDFELLYELKNEAKHQAVIGACISCSDKSKSRYEGLRDRLCLARHEMIE